MKLIGPVPGPSSRGITGNPWPSPSADRGWKDWQKLTDGVVVGEQGRPLNNAAYLAILRAPGQFGIPRGRVR